MKTSASTIAQLVLYVAFSAPIFAASPKTPPSEGGNDPKAPFSAAIFPLIAATQTQMKEAMAPVESPLADELVNKTNKFLADKQVYQKLVDIAYERAKIDEVGDEPDRYARQSLASLTSSIRLTPGVMGRDALINRAKLISQVAKYYSKHNPGMCRYLPSDFNILLSVDAPWVEAVDETVFSQALDDEIEATKRMLAGSPPLGVNDSDAQKLFSKFATEWLAGLDSDTKYQIGSAKTRGNYCELWRFMFTDFSRMAESFPASSEKLLRPVLTMMSRGWMDSELWSYEQRRDEQSFEAAPQSKPAE